MFVYTKGVNQYKWEIIRFLNGRNIDVMLLSENRLINEKPLRLSEFTLYVTKEHGKMAVLVKPQRFRISSYSSVTSYYNIFKKSRWWLKPDSDIKKSAQAWVWKRQHRELYKENMPKFKQTDLYLKVQKYIKPPVDFNMPIKRGEQ